MTRWYLSYCALSLSVASVLLAGCGRLLSPGGMPHGAAPLPARAAVHRVSTSASYQLLYAFRPPPYGSHPTAGLLDVSGTLYGTTSAGGLSHLGTVYSISPSGVHKVIYKFRGGSDGRDPEAGLIDVDGTLYGTTQYGGTYGWGTVFSITPSGREAVLHSFEGSPHDGQRPAASLLNVNGTLYGTTQYGGSGSCGGGSGYNGCGSVFKITRSGRETVLHNFDGFHGWSPTAALINVNGTLYGTTVGNTTPYPGTIFKISTSGKENTFYYFKGAPADGSGPYAGLTDVSGTLYGTTQFGGSGSCAGGTGTYEKGCGTVFTITPSGTETLLYSFEGYPSDGADPYSDLLNVNGTLYGTTSGGGSDEGTVYSISTSGLESVLYSFAGGSDGSSPQAPLIYINGTLYGTTFKGGARKDHFHHIGCGNNNGCGTVFDLTL